MTATRITPLLLGVLIGASLATPVARAQDRPEPAVLLQAAVHTELVEGDLARAIQLYGDIVANHEAERAVAAKALLYMGRSYEKLGSAEATAAYERVVRDYADEVEQVEAARELL